MNGTGKWFLARPAFKGSGPVLSGSNARRYLPPPLPPATGSTSMSAS